VALRTLLATKWVHQLFPQESARVWNKRKLTRCKNGYSSRRNSMAYLLT
jgi:hypothetical protein